MTEPNAPTKAEPDRQWPHYEVWRSVNAAFYSLPSHFETDLFMKGINATEIFSVGGVFSSVVETQVVTILNSLRTLWDPANAYSNYAFIRQSQTFPDVLLRNLQDEEEILFGLELKSWYILSKEGEPSFRYQITPEACADADLVVIIPWILSDVISGTPKLLRPYTESARYVAQYRNFYWQNRRRNSGKNPSIQRPPQRNRHPYPSSKQEASDQAEDDKGGNFGRIARAGILDEYVASLKQQDYLGIKISHWIAFFKAISETRTDAEIERRILSLRSQIQSEESPSQRQRAFIEILDRLEDIWGAFP